MTGGVISIAGSPTTWLRLGSGAITLFCVTTTGALRVVEYPKDPRGFCLAVKVVVPALRNIKDVPLTVAIVGSAMV